jgi:polynucleotide 5'-hydroxyl-kinase GRC3/NOL9
MIHLPPDWSRALEALAVEPWRRVIVLGARDRGKSTFCQALAQRLALADQPAWLLDTDLGQKLFGPPACVSLADASGLRAWRFVGETNPVQNMAGVVAASARLADMVAGARLIINTSGLISGPGVALKRWKIEALAPDKVIAIAAGDELAPVLAPLQALAAASPPIRLGPSEHAREKRASRRASARAVGWRAAFEGARVRPLQAAVVEDLHRQPPLGVRLAAVANGTGRDLALGLVRLEDAGLQPWIFTVAEPDAIARVRVGMLAEPSTVGLLPSDAGGDQA